MNDLRFAFRQLRKSPGFTIIAVLTLALGIGANSAIFSVVNHVLLRPLPYPKSDRLVYLNEVINGSSTSIALMDYVDWRKESKSFEHLAIARLESRNLSGIGDREPERISVAYVTSNFFSVIGLNAIAAYMGNSIIPVGHIVGIFTSEAHSPLLHGLAVLVVEWLVLYWMYRRKIFLKA